MRIFISGYMSACARKDCERREHCTNLEDLTSGNLSRVSHIFNHHIRLQPNVDTLEVEGERAFALLEHIAPLLEFTPFYDTFLIDKGHMLCKYLTIKDVKEKLKNAVSSDCGTLQFWEDAGVVEIEIAVSEEYQAEFSNFVQQSVYRFGAAKKLVCINT